ncbi:BAG domain-containing protein starvin isoform 1-T2 [Glossina fuscipes fuscipes]
MKPTVIPNSNSSSSQSSNYDTAAPIGINIPINHEYSNVGSTATPYHTQAQHYVPGDPHTAYGSPSTHIRVNQQQQHPQQETQQSIPASYQQDFGFEPDMDVDMDMFPRSRLGRIHDPFTGFGGSRKRISLHDPHFRTDGFSRYFDDAADFAFPQFNSLGRRRANTEQDDDFFHRMPAEFREYMPQSFGHRHAPNAGMHPQATHSGTPGGPMGPPPAQTQYYTGMPQSPTKKVCDAAIQTEDPAGRSEVDHAVPTENLSQQGLRNTVDMGVKSEREMHGTRSHSAPPNEQQIPINDKHSGSSPPLSSQHSQYTSSQTSPQMQSQYQKSYHTPQRQPQQQQQHYHKQQTPPPPQTPGGTFIRTIPIFVEGRSEPIINNKEIPNQNSASSTSTPCRSFTPPKQHTSFHQQSHRPTPLNTHQQQQQQQQSQQAQDIPPQTPHTMDSINKIQDIQRDVLELMSHVEKFTGTRGDKEYVYLDEMLTRNLLKLDNIDTNGKDSIRLARKEAIKCIQASINVLEAKAEENVKRSQSKKSISATNVNDFNAAPQPQKSASGEEITKEKISSTNEATKDSANEQKPADATKIQEPIPLPPPEGMINIENESQQLPPAKVIKEVENEKPGKAAEESKSQKETSPIATEAKCDDTTETK